MIFEICIKEMITKIGMCRNEKSYITFARKGK